SDGHVLQARAPSPLRRDRRGQPRARRVFLPVLRTGLRGRRAHGAREGAHRARRRPHRAVPVLHRRVHGGVAGEGGGPGADDRGRPRRHRDPGRRLARPRPPDARPGEGQDDVSGMRNTADPGFIDLAVLRRELRLDTAEAGPKRTTSLRSRRTPLAAPAEQLRTLGAVAVASGPTGTGRFDADLAASGWPALTPAPLEVFQINVGKLCDLTRRHCHVDSGPDRPDATMDRATVDACLAAIDRLLVSPDHALHTVDLTGGAPELNPHFEYLVDACV